MLYKLSTIDKLRLRNKNLIHLNETKIPS